MKRCNLCKKEIFWKEHSYPKYCFECAIIIQKNNRIQYKLRNKERVVSNDNRYRKENSEKIRIYQKIHYKDNREEILERNKKWQENNRDKAKQIKNKWVENNPILRAVHLKVANTKSYPLTKECQVKCSEFCSKVSTERHHEDYLKPYEYISCCKPCHYQLDLQRRERENDI